MTYASLFYALKRRSGVTTDNEFADWIGISRGTIHNILNGKHEPNTGTVLMALNKAGLSLGDLQIPSENPATQREIEALELFRQLSDQNQNLALDVMRSFREAQKSGRKPPGRSPQ